jgi:hypothetical protein
LIRRSGPKKSGEARLFRKKQQGPFGNICIARTKDLEGKGTFDPKPTLP